MSAPQMARTARLRRTVSWCVASCGFGLLACALTWPLPLHFRTHLLGDPSGDLGIYIWNIWIFHHELVDHWHLPFSTDHVFAYTGGLDFALHNYTPLAGILSVPLLGWLGVVGTFNAIVLAFIALSGLGVFLLARRLGLAPWAAWCAGALFVASPTLTTRGTEHFSLITAAPIPLFLWALLRALDTARRRDAVLVGILVAVATYSDAYYGIYCTLAGAFLVTWRFVRLEVRGARIQRTGFVRLSEVGIASAIALIAWRLLSGTTVITLLSIRIGLETLYTPVLVLVVMVSVRAWLAWRPAWTLDDPHQQLSGLLRRGSLAVIVSLVLLLPLILGIAHRLTDDRLPETATYWRSSPPGVDVLAYFVPNPLHPWFGASSRSWLSSDGFPEFVASFSIVALVVIAIAARDLPRMWVAFTGFAVLLSVGPFLQVAGFNTHVIGPWALLRYAPVLGMARSPSRFAILAALGLSLLFAFAVAALARRHGGRWKIVGSLLAAALALELTPVPRVLYPAEVPDIYRWITATSDDTGRLLEVPTGVRDGTSSLGRFNAASQYFQTKHRRPMIGGYVSRVSPQRKRENLRSPVLRALFDLSEGRVLSPEALERARAARDAFLRRSCVRFVIVDKRRASDDLREFVHRTLRLNLVHEDDAYELLVPVDPPPCDPSRRRGHRARSRRSPP